MTDVSLTVSSGPARLDTFLHAAVPGLSRRLVHRLIAEGDVRVNGRRARKGASLRAGDVVTLPPMPASIAPEAALALPVLYADDELAAVDKPGGMPGHALDPRQRGTAAAFLVGRWPELAGVGDPLAPGLVHRLDTGTSGVLLAARTAEAHATVRGALRARAVEKRYLAVVEGRAGALDGRRIALALAHDRRDRRRMVAATGAGRAWPAETALAVVDVRGSRTLVEATIRTGVTHQVRVHLAHAGHPVVGDVLYGAAPAALPATRHALHATQLTLPHPADGRAVVITSALPPDLAALV